LPLAASLLAFVACGQETHNAGRQTVQGESMDRMRAAVETIRAYAKGADSQTSARQAAMELSAWSDRMADLFPPDTAPKQYVDMTAEMARAAPSAMRREAAGLLAAIDSGKTQPTAVALASMEKNGCGACHQTVPYR
jgi:hypothetical protein